MRALPFLLLVLACSSDAHPSSSSSEDAGGHAGSGDGFTVPLRERDAGRATLHDAGEHDASEMHDAAADAGAHDAGELHDAATDASAHDAGELHDAATDAGDDIGCPEWLCPSSTVPTCTEDTFYCSFPAAPFEPTSLCAACPPTGPNCLCPTPTSSAIPSARLCRGFYEELCNEMDVESLVDANGVYRCTCWTRTLDVQWASCSTVGTGGTYCANDGCELVCFTGATIDTGVCCEDVPTVMPTCACEP